MKGGRIEWVEGEPEKTKKGKRAPEKIKIKTTAEDNESNEKPIQRKDGVGDIDEAGY